jgi:hypothetical protein
MTCQHRSVVGGLHPAPRQHQPCRAAQIRRQSRFGGTVVDHQEQAIGAQIMVNLAKQQSPRSARAADVAEHTAGGAFCPGGGPGSIQEIEVLVIVETGRRVQLRFELHLVTAAQRGYSLRLFERHYRQFTGRSFVKCTARPTYAF